MAGMEQGASKVTGCARNDPPGLRLLHFNDVYHVEAGSRDPVGGVARFQTVCDYYAHDAKFSKLPKLITLFSGDAFNPSLESSVTKGAHMVPVLNALGTDCACVGNHDLDFGVPQFEHLAGQCRFPWLLANVLDPALGPGVSLGHASPFIMLDASSDLRVGVIGLVEREWLDTINSLPPNLVYKSASATAREWAPKLREMGADMVIAVTHQREPNDVKLAEKTPAGMLDLILGGHDHFYGHQIVNGTHILRSGTDFKQLSYIQAWKSNLYARKWEFDIVRRDIVQSIAESDQAKSLVDGLQAKLRTKLEKPIGYTAAPLDARFDTVRLRESNYGNFVCDLMRLHYQADCAVMASGTMRGDQIYPPGILRVKDVMNCFPFEDPIVVIRLDGASLLHAIENGVSTYPALEGRFPQVSNIVFRFDPKAQAMSRVTSIKVGGEALDTKKQYTLATRDYMVRGKDGYTSLLTRENGGAAETLVSDENGMLISTLLRQYFMSLKILGQWSRWGGDMGTNWTRIHAHLHQAHPVVEPAPATGSMTEHYEAIGRLDDSDDEVAEGPGMVQRKLSGGAIKRREDRDRRYALARRALKHWRHVARVHRHPDLVEPDDQGSVGWARGIAPRVEGRIVAEQQQQ